MVYLDLEQHSFPEQLQRSKTVRRTVSLCEFLAWCRLNHLDPRSFDLLHRPEQLAPTDVLFLFSRSTLDENGPSSFRTLLASSALKLVHLTHYMLGTPAISRNAEPAAASLLFTAEADLSRGAYFRHHFPWYQGSVYLLPFIPQQRFQAKRPFAERKACCLATGTYELLADTERNHPFIDYFGQRTFHPLRKAIYEDRDKLRGLIDSSISFYNQEVRYQEIDRKEPYLRRRLKLLHNLFGAKQKGYFSFDLVERYNQYQMFLAPEELNHLPGIGFVEGMACGCAYLGVPGPMYADLGLQPGKHYLGHDGSLDHLLEVIAWHREHPEVTERVAAAGRAFVSERLDGRRTLALLLEDLEGLVRARAAGPPRVRSSFLADPVR
ncbi:MAG: hypothetical protein A2284_04190 [Deltaproteobacteria bacterium RIFOXYA12_FULL_61_11]|nr:MAG: hypothetical protein A2284_04190 [Deltaproteobacteria bacterium RIFOXYA12_FULL_61_11]